MPSNRLDCHAALWVSTSARCSRPPGVSERTRDSRVSAAVSGWAPGATWYCTATMLLSPGRVSVSSRAPSCGGSTVYSEGNTRVGRGIGPKACSMRASVVVGSNCPVTTSTALSGW
ncbi:hypothetical protein D3C72_1228900 [compost metagenome]